MSTFADLLGKAKEKDSFWEARAQHDIAIQLAKIMRSKGMTQLQFAEAAGVSAAYISKVLAGNENLSVKSLVKLTRALGTSLKIDIGSSAGRYTVKRIASDAGDIKEKIVRTG